MRLRSDDALQHFDPISETPVLILKVEILILHFLFVALDGRVSFSLPLQVLMELLHHTHRLRELLAQGPVVQSAEYRG